MCTPIVCSYYSYCIFNSVSSRCAECHVDLFCENVPHEVYTSTPFTFMFPTTTLQLAPPPQLVPRLPPGICMHVGECVYVSVCVAMDVSA